LGGIATGGLFALGGAAVAGIGFALKEAESARKIGKLTAAVLKSTGGAAHVSAKQVEDLAESLGALSGVDDEVIQRGENLLLTFTNIRNEVGAGNDIFTQATASILDMSAALDQDMKSSAIQLGKALNDPIRGVTALQRVGVSFSEKQKKVIARLVETGDVLGAQKIILKELQTEFGGAAAAAASPMDRLRVTLGNLAEQIGEQLLPIVDKFATWLSEKAPIALSILVAAIQYKLLPFLQKLWDWVSQYFPPIKDFFVEAFQGGKKALEDLADAFGTNESTILGALAAITAALLAVAVAWNLGPGVIITGVVLLGLALLYAYNKFDWFRGLVFLVCREIKRQINLVRDVWDAAFWVVQLVIGAAGATFEWFRDVAVAVYNKVVDVWSTINDRLQPVYDFVKRLVDIAQKAIDLVGKIPKPPGGFPVPGGGVLPPFPSILGSGGIVTRPTFALVGESGPEAVIPLSRLRDTRAGGNVTVNVNVTAPPGADQTYIRWLSDQILRAARDGGPLATALRQVV
jgi:hypothetical protein